MNIVYLLNFKNTPSERGVITKVNCEKKSLEKLGNDVKVITFNKENITMMDDDITHISVAKTNGTQKNIFSKICMNIHLTKRIISYVKELKPDAIYIRDTKWFFNIYSKLSKLAPVFIEVQTDIFNELKIGNNKIQYYFERVLKRKYFRKVKGIVAITSEIGNIEKELNKIPIFILGNGINSEKAKFIPKKAENDKINLLFIGSPNMQWHGVERLIDSFEKAPNKDKFFINIIGYENIYGCKEENIKFHGYISDDKYIDNIISCSDIGISTLSLYKNKMKEAAPLKARNYIQHGLPIVVGYKDVDLDKETFCLEVSNDDSIIDFKKIQEFYYKVRELRYSGFIVEHSIKTISWDLKMDKLNEFIIDNI